MSFVELTNQRTPNAVVFEDSVNPQQRRMVSVSGAPLHYDTGAGYIPVDMTPVRVLAGQWAQFPTFNGWRIETNKFHYALGINGQIGFGGRHGAHWFWFSLRHVGYLDDPVGVPLLASMWHNISDLQPTPAYNTANLSRVVIPQTIEGTTYNNRVLVEWRNLWTTPGGGEVYLRFVVDGARLKAEYIINAAARVWIAANRPPAFFGIPGATAYFSFAFRVDWSNIPRRVVNGFIQGDNFDDTGGGVELRDALDALIAFMPVEQVYAGNSETRQGVPLRKRFWRDANGNDYLVMGAKAVDIAALPAGDLVFDPTITPSVSAGGNDVYFRGDGVFLTSYAILYAGYQYTTLNSALLFTTSGITHGDTVTDAYLTVVSTENTYSSGTILGIQCEDADNSAIITSYADFLTRALTTKTSWTPSSFPAAGNNENTPAFVATVQDVVDRAGFAAGNTMQVFVLDNGSTTSGTHRIGWAAYEHATYNQTQLTITYSVVAASATATLDITPTLTAAASGSPLRFVVELDTLRDGTYGGTYDDITAYVTAMNWRNGMSDAYQDVDTTGAQATFTLKDANGEWRQDWRGTEALTNGEFTAWTSDNPNSWTVVGESGSNPYVNEVGKSELHGGTGTGSCNLYTTGTTLSIRQSALTIGTRYEVILDFDNTDATLAGGIYVKCGSTNISKLYQIPGIKRLFFTATDTSFRIETLGACDITINSVSVLPVQKYCGVLNKETLIRVQAQAPGGVLTTLYIGRLVNAQPTLGEHGRREITLNALCPMQQLLDLEYQPSLLLDTTADAVISEIFDSAALPYPYSYRFWRLGAEGCSVLGVSTTTYTHSATDFDTGNTTFPYTGDAENQTGKGISAQGIIQNMMAAELGRFFFNTRAGQFALHNRARDTLNDTSSESLTFSDFWEINTAGDDVQNIITVNYEPREVGAAGEVIWTATGLPLELVAGAPKEIQARYVDPDSDKPMGAMNFVYPELGVDYIANSSDDGTGNDVTDTVTVAVDFGGSTATVWLSTSTACYITTLQLRGTPLRRFDRQAVTVSDGDSIYVNGEQPAPPVELPAVSSEDYAREVGNYILSRYTNRATRLSAVQFAMGREATTEATRAITRVPGDRITITDTWSQHDQDYFIVGEEHSITAGSAELWSVRWHLRPASREIFWRLGTTGYSELTMTTRLSL